MQLRRTNRTNRLCIPHHHLFSGDFSTDPTAVVVVFGVINWSLYVRCAEPTRFRLESQRRPDGQVKGIEIHTQRRGVLHPDAQGPDRSLFRDHRIGLFEEVKGCGQDFTLHGFAGVFLMPIGPIPQMLNVWRVHFNNWDGLIAEGGGRLR